MTEPFTPEIPAPPSAANPTEEGAAPSTAGPQADQLRPAPATPDAQAAVIGAPEPVIPTETVAAVAQEPPGILTAEPGSGPAPALAETPAESSATAGPTNSHDIAERITQNDEAIRLANEELAQHEQSGDFKSALETRVKIQQLKNEQTQLTAERDGSAVAAGSGGSAAVDADPTATDTAKDPTPEPVKGEIAPAGEGADPAADAETTTPTENDKTPAAESVDPRDAKIDKLSEEVRLLTEKLSAVASENETLNKIMIATLQELVDLKVNQKNIVKLVQETDEKKKEALLIIILKQLATAGAIAILEAFKAGKQSVTPQTQS